MKRKNNNIKRAVQMAKQSIYDGARFIGQWNGFDVYEPTFADNEPRFIGFPQFILAKGKSMRWSDGESESQAIMNEFASDDD